MDDAPKFSASETQKSISPHKQAVMTRTSGRITNSIYSSRKKSDSNLTTKSDKIQTEQNSEVIISKAEVTTTNKNIPLNQREIKKNKNFVGEDNQGKNRKSKVRKKQYVCEVDGCGYRYGDTALLKSHMYRRHGLGSPTIACQLCEKKYFSNVQLNMHMKRKHSDKSSVEDLDVVTSCEECRLELRSLAAMKMHMLKAHQRGKLFTCAECEFRSPRKRDLQGHMLSLHNKEPKDVRIYRCLYCEYRCIEKKRHEEHIAKHTGAPKYLCPLCGKAYTTERGIKTHIQYHSDERPYKCLFCAAAFKVRSKLNEHTRIKHTAPGLKPYHCAYCSHCTKIRGNCNSHIKKSHPGQPVIVIDLLKDKRKLHKEYSWVGAQGTDIEEVGDADRADFKPLDLKQKDQSSVACVLSAPATSSEEDRHQHDVNTYAVSNVNAETSTSSSNTVQEHKTNSDKLTILSKDMCTNDETDVNDSEMLIESIKCS